MDAESSAVEIGVGTYYDPTMRFVTWIPQEKIIIGKFCSVAADVIICTGGNHRPELPSVWPFENLMLQKPNPTRTYKTTRDTTIGNDVWIGHGAFISGGSQIGSGAVIGARAVVFEDIPPYAVVVGNPAKIVRYRFSQKTIERMLRIAWWDWPLETIQARIEWFYKPIGEFVAGFDAGGAQGST